MSARRARRHPPRWFRRSARHCPNYVDGDGYRYQLVIEQPRFPVPDLARSCGLLTVLVPVILGAAVIATYALWVVAFSAVGR